MIGKVTRSIGFDCNKGRFHLVTASNRNLNLLGPGTIYKAWPNSEKTDAIIDDIAQLTGELDTVEIRRLLEKIGI